jgi:hypothetical protein
MRHYPHPLHRHTQGLHGFSPSPNNSSSRGLLIRWVTPTMPTTTQQEQQEEHHLPGFMHAMPALPASAAWAVLAAGVRHLTG